MVIYLIIEWFQEQFGCQHITKEQIDRIKRLTNKEPHYLLKRGLFFSQR